MDYNKLLDLAADIGYRLTMCGAETFRVEESINRILDSYGIQSEVFAIPNCLHVSIETPDGTPITRMRRIGIHGNDLDAVEKYNTMCRTICRKKPDLDTMRQWLVATDEARVYYSNRSVMLGHFLGSFGFSIVFGASPTDAVLSGLCGLIVYFVNSFMSGLRANSFFSTIACAFFLALPAYALSVFDIADNADMVIIGALMLLVPGLLFTNAMRDIIFGDINSGVNRIVQVFLTAAAIALGTAVAWNCSAFIWQMPISAAPISYSLVFESIGCLLGCIGFAIIFNIHGPGGLLCAAGGILAWVTYCLVLDFTGDDIMAYFWGAVISAAYSEVMARIRKYPAISYLVVSIFPLIPGAGVYYTMTHAVRGDMAAFADQGVHTIAIAAIMAVGILLVSTSVRMWGVWKSKRRT